MAVVVYNPNLLDQLQHDPFTRGPLGIALFLAAEAAANAARGIARAEYYRTGAYANRILPDSGDDGTGGMAGWVLALDYKSVWAESPPIQEVSGRRGQILSRGAKAAGLETVGFTVQTVYRGGQPIYTPAVPSF
jgi:hypothetical protein